LIGDQGISTIEGIEAEYVDVEWAGSARTQILQSSRLALADVVGPGDALRIHTLEAGDRPITVFTEAPAGDFTRLIGDFGPLAASIEWLEA
jgi:hypothetical protein